MFKLSWLVIPVLIDSIMTLRKGYQHLVIYNFMSYNCILTIFGITSNAYAKGSGRERQEALMTQLQIFKKKNDSRVQQSSIHNGFGTREFTYSGKTNYLWHLIHKKYSTKIWHFICKTFWGSGLMFFRRYLQMHHDFYVNFWTLLSLGISPNTTCCYLILKLQLEATSRTVTLFTILQILIFKYLYINYLSWVSPLSYYTIFVINVYAISTCVKKVIELKTTSHFNFKQRSIWMLCQT